MLGNTTGAIKGIYQASKFLETTSDVAQGSSFGILLDKTNFYAESGGQEYDTGILSIDGQAEFEVTDVQVFNGYVLHIGSMKEGTIKVGDEVTCTYDEVGLIVACGTLGAHFIPPAQLRRWPLRNNHTATHILNFGLREVLGDHIDQKGSLVAPYRLRFDFSHKAAIALPDLEKIENMSNEWIKRAVKVYSKEMSLAEAQKIPGLRAVFGEAYPDPVRVVTLQFDPETTGLDDPKWRQTSVEFCGGT